MAVLLTGGAGYIGSHTAVELLNAGYDVIIADNYANSNPIVAERIARITGKHVKCYEVDVADSAALEQVFQENHIDSVMHFAGLKAVGESVRLLLAYYRNNLDSTLALLALMDAHGVRRLIFSSSATVYGKHASLPFREDAFSRACGKEIPYRIAPRRSGDVAACYADVSKAKEVLGWNAQLGIDDMCRSAWNWQRRNPNGYEK